MAVTVPDSIAVARAEAAVIKSDPNQFLDGPVERALADAPFIDRDSLLEGLETFHKERMAKIPSATEYPDAQPWVDYVIDRDKELQELTGITDLQMAAFRSLGHYMTFRGNGAGRPTMVEKCRIVYLPDSDRGEFHIKNVDDPITFWKPTTSKPDSAPKVTKLMWDGVGSGMHLDDEPDEIFPLPYREMCWELCQDVPGAVQFLTQYSKFWGGQNIVLYDPQKRNVAIEKSSFNYIDVYEPGENGGSHCSGMACRNTDSPQGRYQAAQRRKYLELYNQPLDGTDMTFWNACDRAEQMLGDLMKKPKVTIDEVFELFTTPWPDGLNKTGQKLHPGQWAGEYTLLTHAELFDQKQYIRWQRDAEGNYPAEPEVFQY
jgi:hypothetical protein